ncbi:conserved hypothetical protein [Histoplasma mississippiense (nom. inval.)]|uniref:conserved hypothetical protein n=1 Tax=Ajellomyces capsulatus (strain NAm1 / WU24) TaxID=2059318 RepID=UPI000157BD8A|nr:conserved hypothetical protein [Histoplasma mississippiense (nom. inval.)]EDN06168.1 conserved hypothetical protein [Histoplasma mississippiense (nom. inval.)]
MMFTATKLQTATYLLGVCLFSISFLVFLNSSISFVVTDLIKLPTGEGDAIGYLIIALALALFVQAKNVYPELLLGRLLFSLGGRHFHVQKHAKNGQRRIPPHIWQASLECLQGCGAVVALLVFLPLPAWFEKSGRSPTQSIKLSYYVVALLSLVISAFNASFLLGFKQPGIGLAYLGGFVARASTVGISLFIPLYVNRYYKYSGLCDKDVPGSPLHILETGLGEIKKSCPKAYIVASMLTGVAQLTALCFAPIFGYFSARSKRHNVPLLSAALAGIIGYIFLTLLPTPQIRGPEGSPVIFAAMALVGISQIGSIVCSLAGLSAHVLGPDHYQEAISCHHEPDGRQTNSTDHAASENFIDTRDHVSDEGSALLPKSMSPPSANGNNLVHLKGSVAGMYSLCGGAGILLLTKVGGLLSDKISPKSPFYLLAGFNGLLLIFGVVISVLQGWNHRKNT